MHMIPIEVRFIVDPGGLCDLVAGVTEMARFHRQVRNFWWCRRTHSGQTRGLHKIMEREVLERALLHLRRAFALRVGTPEEAAADFLEETIGPVAAAASAEAWIEMTPGNAARAAELERILPRTRLVHSIRDGRNVAASVARMHWGPNDPFEALDWWYRRMEQAGVAAARAREPVHTVQLEDLTVREPAATLQRLFEFVGLEITPEVTGFASRHLRADRAATERWRQVVPAERHVEFSGRYEDHLASLASRGLPIPT